MFSHGGPAAGNGGDAMNRAIQAILIAVILVIAATAYLVITEKKVPTLTLSSNGASLGTVPLTAHGFADPVKMSEIEDRLIDEGLGGLNFSGWYRDASYSVPFNKFTVIKENTKIYAGWGKPLFTMTPADPAPAAKPANHESYTLTNVTDGDFTDTTWTVRDAFKSSTPRTTSAPFFSKGSDPPTWTSTGDLAAWTVDLMPGMYDVTMTTTVDGKTKSVTRTHTVEGSITKTFSWHGYDGKPYTITYGITDVNEYIEYAMMNLVREFRIPNIASFIVVTPSVQKIADLIKERMDIAYPLGYTPQELMNVISPFVVSALWASDSDYYFIKGFHKEHSEGGVEYYKYPIESIYDTILYNSQGDCDCKAILIAAIAYAAGFEDVGVFTITGPEGHATAAIRHPSFIQETQSGTVFFLDPETMDGFFASDGNQGHWRLGYMNKKYESEEFTIRLWRLMT